MAAAADCSGDSKKECSTEVERLVAACVADCSKER
jgi:hypothetical protein